VSEPAIVRFVREEDVQGVVALVTNVLAEFGLIFGKGASTDGDLHRLPASYADHGGAFWVAVAGADVVGTCGLFPVAPRTYELRKMYLHSSARGLGLGRRLLDEAVVWSRAQGGRRIALDTTEQMTRAIAFYESHGFVRDDAQIRGARCSRGYVMELA
jgi:putative acetyltransferase